MADNNLFRAVVIAIGIIVGGFGLMISSIFGAIPSGSPDIAADYKATSAQLSNGQLNWLDPYLLDYFRKNNNYESGTHQDVVNTVEQFIYYVDVQVTTTDPKTGKKTTKTEKQMRIRSLLDVMTTDGYSFEQYNLALQLEDVVAQEYGGSASGGGGPGGDVTVPQLRYQDVDPAKLYAYVHERHSLFTLDDMKAMEAASKKYDVNPVLLLAITGQECSFDPTSIDHAQQRHNNPWDVYVSYDQYNTTFADAANIAANTIRHKLASPPPKGEDAIYWINDPKNPAQAYAADPHWPYGVEDIFNSIENYLGTPVKLH